MINLMPLPFAGDALAPHVSAETFAYHHGKHFAAYVTKTNELTADMPNAGDDLEAIVTGAASGEATALFNAAGQAWNHGFFWASLAPPSAARATGALADAISRDFGSHDEMAAEFVKIGTAEFGSGWVWLVTNAEGRLWITSTHDAMPVWISQPVTPLLVCDVWEHAYYVDWRNDRGGFLKAYMADLANWPLAQAQYAAGTGGGAGWRYPA